MKSDWTKTLGATTALAAVLMTAQLSAQQARYKLIDMGTLGGPQSYIPDGVDITAVGFLNNKGLFAAYADTTDSDPFADFCFVDDCQVTRAFVAQKGAKTNLGALSPEASSTATWISSNALISGFSENGELDPLVPGFPQLRAVLWRDARINDLGTLDGGHESAANAVNSAEQVVGISTNNIPDSNSMLALGYQVRAFFWEKGVMRDLGTLGTGTDAQAVLINERGQVVGWSYTNSEPSDICSAVYGFPVSTGSFVWEKTKGMVDIGGSGGSCTVATDLNDRGEVVGQSWSDGDVVGHAFRWDAKTGLKDLGTLGGDFSSAHAINNNGIVVGGSYLAGNLETEAALWSRETVTDLGAVDSDRCSYALGINGTGQVVGISASSTDCDSPRAFLWEPGRSMVDLNSLVSSSAGIHVAIASTINDRGEIGGLGVLPDGETHAVLLVPCSNDLSACTDDVSRDGNTPSGGSVQQRSGYSANKGNSVRRMLRGRIGLASQLPKANGIRR